MRGTDAEAHSAECLSGTGEQAHLAVTPRCGLHAALDFKTRRLITQRPEAEETP
jgi:hypothetical protein